MPDVCDRLGNHSEALPDPTTFYHSLDRDAMYVWRALLCVSAQQLRQSGHIALDSTSFERDQASQDYLQCQSRTVTTIKATTLTDTESLAMLDVHYHSSRSIDSAPSVHHSQSRESGRGCQPTGGRPGAEGGTVGSGSVRHVQKRRPRTLATLPTTDHARGNVQCSTQSRPRRRARCTSSSQPRECERARHLRSTGHLTLSSS